MDGAVAQREDAGLGKIGHGKLLGL
jgi:hypothetical protein